MREFGISTTVNRRTLNFVVVLVVATLIVAGHLLPGLDDTAIDAGIRNALHVIVFAMLAGLVFILFRGAGLVTRTVATFAVVIGAGVAAEFGQLVAGRQFSVVDLGRDVAGALLSTTALLVWRTSQTSPRRVWRVLAKSVSIILAVAILLPLGYWLSIIALGRSAAPSILSFDNDWDSHLFFTVNSDFQFANRHNADTGGNEQSAELTLSDMWRSGIGVNTLVHDWRSYEYLVFDAVMVSGPRTRISVRVNDKRRFGLLADEFISRAWVETTPGKIRIPLHRVSRQEGRADLDMSNIRQFFVFARNKRAGTVMRLDNFRLERE